MNNVKESNTMTGRARVIALSGGVDAALMSAHLGKFQDLSLSEAVVLGLLRQGVDTYIGVFGHGTTDLGEALRVYESEGLVKVHNVRSEIEASHAAAALRWQYGKTAAVFTSIGPGALHAMAASLVPLSNGLGVYYLFGGETTQDEGYNMQQIPRPEQGLFPRLFGTMGTAYELHTGEALPAALKRGAASVFSPLQPSPCYLILPMNVQAKVMVDFNVAELPRRPEYPPQATADEETYEKAVELIRAYDKITVKVGRGALGLDRRILEEFLGRSDAVYVHGPSAVGILSGANQRNMTVGGSKGSTAGNAAMAEAELAIVIGARAVCQWDSSGTAWKNLKAVISINSRHEDATHYNGSLCLLGDARAVLTRFVETMRRKGMDKGAYASESASAGVGSAISPWLRTNIERRKAWDEFLATRKSAEALFDAKFGATLLTQPVAIGVAIDFARSKDAVKYFDAGDVQANGFQLIEDDQQGETLTDTGASYMGFASCGILASALVENPKYPIAFTGDGSFMMNPQILLDAVEMRLRGMIIVFDNRRMAAISSLQLAQYGKEFRTDDDVAVDYAKLASCFEGVKGFEGGCDQRTLRETLEIAYRHEGLSLVHVPVYSGPDERGGLGAYGDWNVGSWCDRVQKEKHRLGL
jgi:3D-(3,5/4)-trihydroxycyclohexane-1,2-dione acylhydrolase (decyclizing)